MTVEERVVELEKAFVTLTHLAVSASERADTHESWINTLGTRMEEFGTRMEELAEAQKQTQAHLSVLAEIVSDIGRAQARTEQTLASLTEKIDRYIDGQN